jgi:sulfofructose kinase
MAGEAGRPRILGVGLACLDYLFLAPRVAAGGLGPLRAHAVEGGGLTGTALAAAARLGAETEIWTWVGEDAEGELVLEGLREAGVEVRRAEVIPGARTPVSFIHVDEESGERTIYHAPYLSVRAERAAALGEREIDCDVMVMDTFWPEAARAAVPAGKAARVRIVGDFCPFGGFEELAGRVTAVIAPHTCGEAAGRAWGERLEALARLGPSFVAITAGPEGCYYLEEGRAVHQPAFAVDVVDTTGAGDVFHGGFAYALARGWPSAQSVEFASAVAGLSCRALGGRAAIPTLEEARSFLREHGSGRWDWSE